MKKPAIFAVILLPFVFLLLVGASVTEIGFQVNPITTNSPVGMTNVITAIAGSGGGGQVWTRLTNNVNDVLIFPTQTNGSVLVNVANLNDFVTPGGAGGLVLNDNARNEPFQVYSGDSTRPIFTRVASSLIGFINGTNGFGPFTVYSYNSGVDTTALIISFDGRDGVLLDPFSDDGLDPFMFGTSTNNIISATGNLLSVSNGGTNKVVLTGSGQVILAGTTNQITFGSTNTAPQTPSTIVKWISVQVQGENNAYRIPLYK